MLQTLRETSERRVGGVLCSNQSQLLYCLLPLVYFLGNELVATSWCANVTTKIPGAFTDFKTTPSLLVKKTLPLLRHVVGERLPCILLDLGCNQSLRQD